MTKQDMTYVIGFLRKKNAWITLIPEELEDYASMVHDEMIEFEKKAEEEWHKFEKPKSADFEGADTEFARDCRLRFLREERRELLKKFKLNREIYDMVSREDAALASLVAERGADIVGKLRKLDRNIAFHEKSDVGGITPEMIDRARGYPIDRIVDAQHGRAVCVFHEGARNRNMDVRNGFAYCHKCGQSGDAISVYRKVTGASFVQAVAALNQ